MTRQTLAAVLVAALLVLAGCSGLATPPADESSGVTDDATGSVEFYVSDDPTVIDDFEHLNVTITKVGLHRTSDAGNASADSTNGTANATATPTPDAEGDGDGEWVEHDVERTVDLTELAGANATKLDVLEVPAGTYDTVFIYVDEIEATLTTGEQVNVKLPSERLQIHKSFSVGDGEPVQFVFDIAPHKAGKSGKYILKPVISESGTGDEVDIEDVDDRDEGADGDERDDEAQTDLTAAFVGQVEAGSEATLKVTGADGPVADATVEVNDEIVGQTDESGTITFTVPEDAEELEIVVTSGNDEVELERDLERGNASFRTVR